MTVAGAGAWDVWATTLLYEQAVCQMWWHGVPPSQYYDWSGTVWNSNQAYGSTRALVAIG